MQAFCCFIGSRHRASSSPRIQRSVSPFAITAWLDKPDMSVFSYYA